MKVHLYGHFIIKYFSQWVFQKYATKLKLSYRNGYMDLRMCVNYSFRQQTKTNVKVELKIE